MWTRETIWCLCGHEKQIHFRTDHISGLVDERGKPYIRYLANDGYCGCTEFRPLSREHWIVIRYN
jgi:hypothetical protein